MKPKEDKAASVTQENKRQMTIEETNKDFISRANALRRCL